MPRTSFKRGFAATLVAALLLAALAHSQNLLKTVEEQHDGETRAALAAEKLHSAEENARSSLQMVLQKAGGRKTEAKKRLETLAQKLAEWEDVFEKKMAKDGVETDAWAGWLKEGEKSMLPLQMLGEKRVIKCGACINLPQENAVELLEEIGALSAPNSNFSNADSIYSNTNYSNHPNSSGIFSSFAIEEIAGGQLVFGASFFLPGEKLASVAVLQETKTESENRQKN